MYLKFLLAISRETKSRKKNERITHKTILGYFFQIYKKSEGITHKNLRKRKNHGS